MTKDWCLNVEKMQDGGFVVFEGRSSRNDADPYRMCGPLFACSTIGEALEFIRSRLAPEGAEERKRYNAALNQAPNMLPDPNSSSGMRIA